MYTSVERSTRWRRDEIHAGFCRRGHVALSALQSRMTDGLGKVSGIRMISSYGDKRANRRVQGGSA
jgi:hypothetical protein